MRHATFLIFALFATFAIGNVQAQTYPTKPVRLIAPFPAGGGTDILARMIARKLGEDLSQSFVVDNRTGAAGIIGTEAVARATPDGPERAAIYVKMQDMLEQSGDFLFITHEPYTVVTRKGITPGLLPDGRPVFAAFRKAAN